MQPGSETTSSCLAARIGAAIFASLGGKARSRLPWQDIQGGIMSVSSIGSNTGFSQIQWRSSVRQARQDFEQLFQSMQSGDLSGAQQAYLALQQLQSNNTSSSTTASSGATASSSVASTASTASTSTTGSASTAGNAIAGDWSALGQALQSGDLNSAQSAFSKLEQDLQSSAQRAGHRHHHHDVDQAQSVYSAMQGGNANAATGTGNSTNTVGNDISALQKALQSGDTASAQNLLAQLQNDLQASGQMQGHGHHHHRGFATQSPMAAYNNASTTGVAAASAGANTGSSTTA
jgi:hypothetical protein